MQKKYIEKNIFHITPHLGGGVGKVLLNWLVFDTKNYHEIATLDYANDNAIKICKEQNVPLFAQCSASFLNQKIANSDITIIHFWNHPLLYDYMVKNEFPKSRIVVWSHISGANPPYVFNKKIFNICEKLIYTTPISYNYFVKNDKTGCIFSTGGCENLKDVVHKKHEGFNACYAGTVDFAKMHQNYVGTLSKTCADKIFIVGGDREKEIFKNADKRFEIMGKIHDIKDVLSQSDVFAYLLNPNHYGTGEQVLQEAMAVGVVPVVLNNMCEKSLIKHQETGLIANNLEEYVEFINLLKEDKNLRKTLSENAKAYATENFSLKKLTNQWQEVFDEVINLLKTEKKWEINKKDLTSYDIFLESLGDYAAEFKKQLQEKPQELLNQNCWNSDTKGTPRQYYNFLGGDELKKLLSYYK